MYTWNESGPRRGSRLKTGDGLAKVARLPARSRCMLEVPTCAWREVSWLDPLDLEPSLPPPGRLYSNQPWENAPGCPAVELVRRNRLLAAVARSCPGRPAVAALARALSDVGLACRLLARSCRRSSVGMVEADRAGMLFCRLRSFLPTPGKVVLFGFYLYPLSGLKRRLIRRAVRAATVCVVWSRRQSEHYCRELCLPARHFVGIPYKSNHSQCPREEALRLGDYVFSGGDSERDYATLFEAVAPLVIPVVVSTTDRRLTEGAEIPPNVLLVRAQEPHFRRLMAAARVVVVPLLPGRLRGAGEASFLNAMWHGRPVICGDDVSAPEYIDDGVDGIVVAPGDPAALRQAILRLWKDRPRAEAMGGAARAKVEACYTHELFCARMLKLACLLLRGGRPRELQACAGAPAQREE